MTETAVVITAAGSSSRLGLGVKKEYMPLGKGSVLSQAAKAFLEAIPTKFLVITHPENQQEAAERALFADSEMRALCKNTQVIFTCGGKDREESVFCALKALKAASFSDEGIVLVHDGARPFVSVELIERTAKAAEENGAAVPALEPVDTQKEIDEEGKIVRHLKRASLASVQTPQAFRFLPFFQAHEKARSSGEIFTDDTEIWDKFSGLSSTKTVKGDEKNIKITFAKDLEALKDDKKERRKLIHTGLGYDLHPLVEGRALVLGGVTIPFERGEAGHSDGDALLHAITDALLGAAGLGDIGSYFPPEEAKWKDANSADLLKTVWADIKKEGWNLVNLDAFVHLEKPKFLPHRKEVCQSIAKILSVDESQVFVKAKTGEKLGEIGRGEAVEVFATCLLEK